MKLSLTVLAISTGSAFAIPHYQIRAQPSSASGVSVATPVASPSPSVSAPASPSSSSALSSSTPAAPSQASETPTSKDLLGDLLGGLSVDSLPLIGSLLGRGL